MLSVLISETKMFKSRIASFMPKLQQNPQKTKSNDDDMELKTMKEHEHPDLTLPSPAHLFEESMSNPSTQSVLQSRQTEDTDETVTGNTVCGNTLEQSNSDNKLPAEPWVFTDGTNPPQLLHLDSDTIKDESSLENLDNNVWQNPDSKEIKKYQDVTESFVRSVLNSMQKRNESLKFKLIPCGSYYEGLRVGLPFEFDYMLELNNFKAVQVIPNNSHGWEQKLEHMEVKFVTTQVKTPVYAPSNLFAEAQMQFMQFKKSLVPIFRECVRRHGTHQGIKVIEVTDHYNSPNFKLYLKYQGKGVMVDLVPCVQFPETCSDKLPKYLEDTIALVTQIVPECPKTKQGATKFVTKQLQMVCTDLDSKWRISTSIIEYIIMKNLPHEVKRSLRIIKYLCNMHMIYKEPHDTKYVLSENSLKLYGYKPFITTYALKQLFLHKVIEFRLMLNDGSTEQIIVESMLQYLKDFKNCTKKSFDSSKVEISSFLFGNNHLHKFIFGQDLALLRNKRYPPVWYKEMLDIILNILHNDGNAFDKCNRKLLNYPNQEGVKCYPRTNLYAE